MACVVVVVGVNKEELVDVESWSAAAEAAMTAHGAARQLFESKWRVDIFLCVLWCGGVVLITLACYCIDNIPLITCLET